MSDVLLFLFNLAWPPACTFAFALVPFMRAPFRWLIIRWLIGGVTLGALLSASGGGWPSAGSWLSALIAAVILWWHWKRPDRALRQIGAKARARIAEMVRQMPRSRVPVPAGAR